MLSTRQDLLSLVQQPNETSAPTSDMFNSSGDRGPYVTIKYTWFWQIQTQKVATLIS